MTTAIQQALDAARQARRAPPTQEEGAVSRLYRVRVLFPGKPGERTARWYAVAAASEELARARAAWAAGVAPEAVELTAELLEDGILLTGLFKV